MDGLQIVKLSAENVGLLDNIAPGVFDNDIRPDQRDAFIANQSHHMVLAHLSGLVVGMASGFIYFHPDKDPSMVVLEVGVGDDWLRRGIGTKLMENLLEIAEEGGCEEAWLGTETDNHPALALYRGLDFGEESLMTLFTYDTEPD